MAGTEGAHSPFVSPDSQWVGFFAGGRLRKIRVEGAAAAEDVCEAPADSAGAAWSDDGSIVFAPLHGRGLVKASASGGEPQPLTQPDARAGEMAHGWPQVLPAGRGVIFTVSRRGRDSRIAVLTADGKTRQLSFPVTGQARVRLGRVSGLRVPRRTARRSVRCGCIAASRVAGVGGPRTPVVPRLRRSGDELVQLVTRRRDRLRAGCARRSVGGARVGRSPGPPDTAVRPAGAVSEPPGVAGRGAAGGGRAIGTDGPRFCGSMTSPGTRACGSAPRAVTTSHRSGCRTGGG